MSVLRTSVCVIQLVVRSCRIVKLKQIHKMTHPTLDQKQAEPGAMEDELLAALESERDD